MHVAQGNMAQAEFLYISDWTASMIDAAVYDRCGPVGDVQELGLYRPPLRHVRQPSRSRVYQLQRHRPIAALGRGG